MTGLSESWNVLFFILHLAGFVAAALLYRGAPCWMQRLTVLGFAIAMGVMVIAFALAMAGVWWSWWVLVAGFALEHIGVLLWLFRVHWQAALERHLEWIRSHSLPSW